MAAFGVYGAMKTYYERAYPREYQTEVEKYCAEFGVEPALAYAVIKAESNFSPSAVSPNDAMGLMQLLPETFEWLQLRMGEPGKYDAETLFEPQINIRYGVFFLSLLQEEFHSVENIAAGYHAGIGAVKGWLSNPEISGDGENLDRIPYADTALYVERITENLKIYRKLYGK